MPTASKDAAGWQVAYTIAGAGEKTITFKTENRFVDADARATITTPAASNPVLTLTDKTGALAMGTATNNVYSPVIDITGTATIGTAGWIAADGYIVSHANYQIGQVNQSLLKNGSTTIASGSTITPSSSAQTILITEGYNSARTLTVAAASTGSPATITSGAPSTVTSTFTATGRTGLYPGFSLNISGTVPAPIIDTEGYISDTIGTKNTNSFSINQSISPVTVGVDSNDLSMTIAPTIRVQDKGETDTGTWVDANGGSAVNTPTTGAYVHIFSPSQSESQSIKGTVISEGYGSPSCYERATQLFTTYSDQVDKYVPIKAGTVTSGTASITSAAFTYNSSNNNFDISGSGNVSAPTFTEGYIASTVGTKNGNTGGATLSTTVNKISIAPSLSSTSITFTPTIQRLGSSSSNIPEAGTAVETRPSSGYYIGVQSNTGSNSISASATVTSAGYGTTTAGQYTTTTAYADITLNRSKVTFIPISEASFANTATSGREYEDISSTAPVLISGDYLYINPGYTPAKKISLARLVPDATGTNAPANYILSGYTAFNNDGTLITGTMQSYDGTYTIT